MSATWAMVDDERREFVALAESLTPAQWDAPSLCEGWRVRDVVGHVIWVSTNRLAATVGKVLLSGLRLNTVFAREAVAIGSRSTDELVNRLRPIIGTTPSYPGSSATIFLADTLMHQQDIRRPLGLNRTIAAERVRPCLDLTKGNNHTGAKKRIAGLRLFALDLDWSHGTGPEVKGTGEQLLMVMNGRMSVVGELSGAGKAALAERD